MKLTNQSSSEYHIMVENFLENQLFNQPTDLCKIMNESGSDKGSGHHNFTTFYHYLFSKIKDQDLNIFEMGLGTNNTGFPSNMGPNGIPGASIKGWRTFFNNANIFGADIDKGILFTEPRIRTYYCDQTNSESINNMWIQIPEEFDIIIEDGLHEFNANIHFFMHSHHKLKTGGFYIIEDIQVNEINKFENFIDSYSSQFGLMKLIQIPNSKNSFDNNLLLIVK
jgi:hypothetical protein